MSLETAIAVSSDIEKTHPKTKTALGQGRRNFLLTIVRCTVYNEVVFLGKSTV